MSLLPATVTLVGQQSTNPALPQRNLSGVLKITRCNLVFSSGKFTHKIPLEHIDKIETQRNNDLFGCFGRGIFFYFIGAGCPYAFLAAISDPNQSVFMSFVVLILLLAAIFWFFWLIWFLFFRYTETELRFSIVAWDEEHGMDATSTFTLGQARHWRSDMPVLIQEIWHKRGQCRQSTAQRHEVVYQG